MSRTDDPSGPDGGRDAEGDEELRRQFEAWQESGKDLAIGPGGAPVYTAPAEPGDPIRTLVAVRKRRNTRIAFMVVLCALAAFAVYKASSDLAYLSGPTEPIDLGSAIDRFAEGERSLTAESNAFVRLGGLVMTDPTISESHSYFYCPLLHVIVRTPDDLPEKSPRGWANLEIPEAYAPIIEQRLAFPEDLSAFYEGTGRIFHVDAAPGWANGLLEYYGPKLGEHRHDAWILVVGGEPADFYWILGVFAAVALAVLISGWIVVRAWRYDKALTAELKAQGLEV
jgi:hypothetical protein